MQQNPPNKELGRWEPWLASFVVSASYLELSTDGHPRPIQLFPHFSLCPDSAPAAGPPQPTLELPWPTSAHLDASEHEVGWAEVSGRERNFLLV